MKVKSGKSIGPCSAIESKALPMERARRLPSSASAHLRQASAKFSLETLLFTPALSASFIASSSVCAADAKSRHDRTSSTRDSRSLISIEVRPLTLSSFVSSALKPPGFGKCSSCPGRGTMNSSFTLGCFIISNSSMLLFFVEPCDVVYLVPGSGVEEALGTPSSEPSATGSLNEILRPNSGSSAERVARGVAFPALGSSLCFKIGFGPNSDSNDETSCADAAVNAPRLGAGAKAFASEAVLVSGIGCCVGAATVLVGGSGGLAAEA
mmetsp:Transcript_117732/g.293566  ORF Transcript_117732/g.293566 Transcript_117732/m.293566 type:complete len:267 (+) Transcript_117732:637-1437(+)